MMKKMTMLFLVMLIVVPVVGAQEKVSIKPSGPRFVGPPPIPFEADVLRYVFQHFPDVKQEEVMAFIGENFKTDLPEFRKLADSDASKASVFMINLVRDALVLMDIARKDSTLAEMMIRQKRLERQAERKAKEVSLADDAEKGKLSKELRKMLEQAFDAKQELMIRDLSGMQAELKKLEEMISKRNEHREKIIQKKLNEMTLEENYLKW